jgi:AcrR family transcriptional regulator
VSPAAKVDAETAREAVLDAADSVFYAHGVGGTGMAEIRDASGVSLRRLYGLYPSKQDLVAGWLETRHTSWMAWFRAEVERRVDDGAVTVNAIFDTLSEWASTPGYRGCAFLNTAAEVGEIDDRHLHIIAAHKRSLVEYLADLMRDDGVGNPESLGLALGVLVDGAIVQSAVFGSLDPIHAANTAATQLTSGSWEAGAGAPPSQQR